MNNMDTIGKSQRGIRLSSSMENDPAQLGYFYFVLYHGHHECWFAWIRAYKLSRAIRINRTSKQINTWNDPARGRPAVRAAGRRPNATLRSGVAPGLRLSEALAAFEALEASGGLWGPKALQALAGPCRPLEASGGLWGPGASRCGHKGRPLGLP